MPFGRIDLCFIHARFQQPGFHRFGTFDHIVAVLTLGAYAGYPQQGQQFFEKTVLVLFLIIFPGSIHTMSFIE